MKLVTCKERGWHFHEARGNGVYMCLNCGHSYPRFTIYELDPDQNGHNQTFKGGANDEVSFTQRVMWIIRDTILNPHRRAHE